MCNLLRSHRLSVVWCKALLSFLERPFRWMPFLQLCDGWLNLVETRALLLLLNVFICFSMSLFASQCLYFSNSHWLLVAQKLLKYLAAHWLPLAQKLLKLVHWPLLKIDTLRTSQIETLRPSQNWHLLKIEILRNFSNWELRTTQNWTSQNWHVRAPLLRRFSKVAQTTTWPRTTFTPSTASTFFLASKE